MSFWNKLFGDHQPRNPSALKKAPPETAPSDKILEIEPITGERLESLKRGLGTAKASELRLNDVDLSRGLGRLPDVEIDGIVMMKVSCLWTHDKHRITIRSSREGTILADCARAPDPKCPEGR